MADALLTSSAGQAPTSIDLSRLPFPDAIERLDFEAMFSAFMVRFQASWDAMRLLDTSLPIYDVGALETDPIVILGQADAYLRLLDRARVNDAVKAVLAPMATGANLDNVVARQGIARLTIAAASGDRPAIMETDAALLRRYLLSFDRPSAGSAGLYLYEAWTAVPALADVRVNGRAVHGRVGDTDVVILGAGGAIATDQQRAAVQAAITKPNVKPEAVGVAAIKADRSEYRVDQTIRVPTGPDADLVRAEAVARIEAATRSRMLIGGALPRDLIAGAAFGASIIEVVHREPSADIAAHPYRAPVCTEISVLVEVIA